MAQVATAGCWPSLELSTDDVQLRDDASDPPTPDYPYGEPGQAQRSRHIQGGYSEPAEKLSVADQAPAAAARGSQPLSTLGPGTMRRSISRGSNLVRPPA